MRLFLFLLFTIICGTSLLWALPTNEIEWTHDIKLPGGLELKWSVTDTGWIKMSMSAPTKGYLGIGFSPSGGMPGSDIALGWVDDEGIPHFKDYHGTKNGAPTEDPKQDYELIDAKENEAGTTIVFRRKWDTCDDAHDSVLGDDTVRLIWAWHEDDPKDHLHWHGSGVQRGVRSIYLKAPVKPGKFPDEEHHPDPEVRHWDITMKNLTVPKTDSYYHCQLFKFPELTKKHHIIGYRPLIREEYKPYVHHINVKSCHVPPQFGSTDEVFEKYIGQDGKDCFADDVPNEWNEYCFTYVMANAVGAEGEMSPDHLGSSIGENGGHSTYLRLEVHYEDTFKMDMVDSSGIRIFYTPKLREFDKSMVFAGHRRTPFLSIPPSSMNFKISGHCSSGCTKMGLPDTGIKLVSVLLHAHRNARVLTLRHIRNGLELPVIAQDKHYDFNYQEYRTLPKEVLVLPGDELVMECDYYVDELNNRTFVFGGLTAKHEMCEAFIFYYPKASLADCRSQPEFYSYLESMNVGNVSGNILGILGLPYDPETVPENVRDLASPDHADIITFQKNPKMEVAKTFEELEITSPNDIQGNMLQDYMNKMDWDDENMVKKIEAGWRTGPRYMFCSDEKAKRIKLKNYLAPISKYTPLPPPEPHQCQ